MKLPPTFTVKEVAARYGVTRDTLATWARTGKLPRLRLGWRTVRYTEAQLSEFERTAFGAKHVRDE